jgi:broad specificity phosphatase PhoE
MVRLYLIRHGETDWNRNQRVMGQLDIPLNKTGKAQAVRTAEFLASESLSAIYASDSSRAWETALHISEKQKLTPIRTPELRELMYGRWEGLTREEVIEKFPEEYAERLNNPFEFCPTGGESRRQLFERASKKLDEIFARHKNKKEKIALVSHGGTCRVMVGFIAGINGWGRFAIDNCSISVIDELEDGTREVSLVNSTYHLKDLYTKDFF